MMARGWGSCTAYTHIVAGTDHTCVILTDQSVKCWGGNVNGQTGEEGTPNLGGQAATAIAAGYNHTCAILADQSVKCWGKYRGPYYKDTDTDIVFFNYFKH